MNHQSTTSVILPLAGATTGAGISATIGGVGLVGGFGGIGLGVGAMTGVGALAGAAVYGGIHAISEGDITAIGAVSLGVAGGVGVSASIGGVGLGFAGGAIGIGMGTMAAAGGIVGLGIYGIAKIFDQSSFESNFYRNLYFLEQITQEYESERVWAALEVEDELTQMKLEIAQKPYINPIDQELKQLKQEIAQKPYINPIDQELKQLKQEIAQKPYIDPVDQELQRLKREITQKPYIDPVDQELQELKRELKAKKELKSGVSSSQQPILEPKQSKPKQNIDPNQQWQVIRSLKGHTTSINDLAITPDSKIIASASCDRTIRLHDITTGKQIYTFFGQSASIHALAINNNFKTLLAAGFDSKITTWNLTNYRIGRSILAPNASYSHLGFISCLRITPNQKYLISASGDKTIRIWEYLTGNLIRTLSGHQDTVCSLAITPDGKTLVSGSCDRTIRFWDLNTGKTLNLIENTQSWITAVAISNDSNILISGNSNGQIQLWDFHSKQLITTITDHKTAVNSIAIHPHHPIIATGSSNQVNIYNLQTSKLLYILAASSPVIFTPDGSNLITGGDKNQLQVWIQTSDLAWWQILGVNPNSDAKTVKLAYYALAKQYHPDFNITSSQFDSHYAQMQIINQAYQEFLQYSSKYKSL